MFAVDDNTPITLQSAYSTSDKSKLDQIIEKSTVEKSSSPDETLTLVSYSLTRDKILDDPILNVVGEIRNDSEFTQDFVKITATFYNQENRVVGTSLLTQIHIH